MKYVADDGKGFYTEKECVNDEFIEGINILNKNFDLLELHSMLEYINTYNEN